MEIFKIEKPQELLDYMCKNMNYGWNGIDGSKHIGNLKGFRYLYRTSTVEEIVNTGLGTCIESAIIAKAWLDRKNIPVKLFCHRNYEIEDNLETKIKMHIIILYNLEDKWFHFEHSNKPEQGIHEYDNIDDALINITSGFKERGDIRQLSEIDEIPSGVTFKQFNDYVNCFNVIDLNLRFPIK